MIFAFLELSIFVFYNIVANEVICGRFQVFATSVLPSRRFILRSKLALPRGPWLRHEIPLVIFSLSRGRVAEGRGRVRGCFLFLFLVRRLSLLLSLTSWKAPCKYLCFHQHRGKALIRHFFYMCFQQHRGTHLIFLFPPPFAPSPPGSVISHVFSYTSSF